VRRDGRNGRTPEQPPPGQAAQPPEHRRGLIVAARPRPQLIAVAASTGGPQAIQTLLRGLGDDPGVPILVVQHISPGFEAGMASWLTATCPLPMRLAAHGDKPRPNVVYLASCDDHLLVTRSGALAFSKAPPVRGFRPSANLLFESIAESFGARAIGIILTGMGEDGAAGLAALHATGAPTIAQDATSSIVYGMPRAAAELGAAEYVLSLAAISPAVRDLLGIAHVQK
jgi:chemotaxis response regulator CheB